MQFYIVEEIQSIFAKGVGDCKIVWNHKNPSNRIKKMFTKRSR